MRLIINYRFNTNLPSRARGAMVFGIAETTRDPEPATRGGGPVVDGITPSTIAVVETPAEAFAFIDKIVGRTWDEWSLYRIRGSRGLPNTPEYHVFFTGHPATNGRISGQPARLICARYRDGQFVAKSF